VYVASHLTGGVDPGQQRRLPGGALWEAIDPQRRIGRHDQDSCAQLRPIRNPGRSDEMLGSSAGERVDSRVVITDAYAVHKNHQNRHLAFRISGTVRPFKVGEETSRPRVSP